jgi:hypothetical protein
MSARLATPLFDPMHVPAEQLRNEGWMHLRYGRKAHFFRNNVSLCGKFKLEGRDFRMYGLVTEFNPKMDCPVCFKRGSTAITSAEPK